MRKFLIILCGILITQAGFAEKRTLKKPLTESNTLVLDAWDADTTITVNDYDQDVTSSFSISGFYNTKAGTYGTNDEGSIIPIIAKQIYEHGGSFCMIQVQAANGSNSGYFIDYFMDTNGTYTAGGSNYKHKACVTICEEGWSGTGCATQTYKCDNPNVDYTKDLNNRQDSNLRITSGKQNDTIRITDTVEVFAFSNGNTNYNSYALVLGVLEQQPHSIKVAPVLINANDHYIKWAKIKSGSTKILCAPGYKVNAGQTDCELADECDPNYVGPCSDTRPSTDLYDEDEHEKVTDTNKKCWYLRCKNGYGFDPEAVSQGTCQPCTQGSKIGVNSATGVCEHCQNPGDFFDDGKCRSARYQIPNMQMTKGIDYMNADNDRECWRESDIAKFKSCVMCEPGKCYNEESHNCGNCPTE